MTDEKPKETNYWKALAIGLIIILILAGVAYLLFGKEKVICSASVQANCSCGQGGTSASANASSTAGGTGGGSSIGSDLFPVFFPTQTPITVVPTPSPTRIIPTPEFPRLASGVMISIIACLGAWYHLWGKKR